MSSRSGRPIRRSVTPSAYDTARRTFVLRGKPDLAPTLVIWGERDRYLGPTLAEPHHDEAERVNELLIDFFAPARAASTT